MACPSCEYDLRGNTTGACPECGRAIGAADLGRANRPSTAILARRLLNGGFMASLIISILLGIDVLRWVNHVPRSSFSPAGGRVAVGVALSVLALLLSASWLKQRGAGDDRMAREWVGASLVWGLVILSMAACWMPL